MIGGKVVLTYKRKRSSQRSSYALQEGYPGPCSNVPASTISIEPRNLEESYKDRTRHPENQDTSEICVDYALCSSTSCLLSCSSQDHARYCGPPNKHFEPGSQLCTVNESQDTLREARKSNTLNTKKQIGECTSSNTSLSCDTLGIPCVSISEKNTGRPFSTELSCENKSGAVGLCLNPVQSCDNEHSHENTASIETELDVLSLRSSTEQRCSSECIDASESNRFNSKGTIVRNSATECGNIPNETRLSPLVTFSRRSRQKKSVDVINVSKPLIGEDKCALSNNSVSSSHYTSICDALSSKGCSGDLIADLTQLEEDVEITEKGIDSSCTQADSTTEIVIGTGDGGEPPCLETGENHQEDTAANCVETLSTNENKDMCSAPETKQPLSPINRDDLEECIILDKTRCGDPPVYAELPSPSPGSCRVFDCNISLSLSFENPIRISSDANLDSVDSTSRSKDTVLEAASPRCQLLELLDAKVGEASVLHHPGIQSRTLKDDGNNNSHFPGVAPKENYLQLFSEEITNHSASSTTTKHKAITCNDSEHERSHPRCHGTRAADLLGLSFLPEAKHVHSLNSATVLPWCNFVSRTGDFIQDARLQSLSVQTSSFLRQKMMVENVVTRAGALNGKRSCFIDNFQLPTSWSEEELDSLWVGVRRHGRGNWDAMLKDPRLHFLLPRSAKELAQRWQREQTKLSKSSFHGTHSRPPDIHNANYFRSVSRIQKKNAADEIQLSLGDVNSHLYSSSKFSPATEHYKEHCRGQYGSMTTSEVKTSFTDGATSGLAPKTNLPHWLREAVSVPHSSQSKQDLPSVASSLHPADMQIVDRTNSAYLGLPQNLHETNLPEASTNITFGSKNEVSASSTVPYHSHANGQEDGLIVIDSDASSEQTISDDHSVEI